MKELSAKMGKVPLTQAAKIKNPKNEVWSVKSLVFAYYTMERYHLFDKPMNNQLSTKYNQQEFMGSIASVAQKTIDRERMVADQQNKAKQEREQRAKEKQLQRNQFHAVTTQGVTTVSRTRSVGTTKRVKSSVKKVPTIRRSR